MERSLEDTEAEYRKMITEIEEKRKREKLEFLEAETTRYPRIVQSFYEDIELKLMSLGGLL
jgi:hypothetical protein